MVMDDQSHTITKLKEEQKLENIVKIIKKTERNKRDNSTEKNREKNGLTPETFFSAIISHKSIITERRTVTGKSNGYKRS